MADLQQHPQSGNNPVPTGIPAVPKEPAPPLPAQTANPVSSGMPVAEKGPSFPPQPPVAEKNPQTTPVPVTGAVPSAATASLVDSLIKQAEPMPSSMPQVVTVNQTSPAMQGGKPPKKSGKGFSAMLVGVLILLITLPVGIYFISQKNTQLTEQRSCAAGTNGACITPGPYANITVPPDFTCNNQSCCHQYANKTCWWRTDSAHPNGYCMCTGNNCSVWGDWGGCHLDSCVCVQTRYCTSGGTDYQIRGCSDASCTPCDQTPTNPPNGSITQPPTSIPGQCSRLRIYKDGVSINPNDAASHLSAGDVVQLAVAGTNATKGRIRVNGSGWGETEVKNGNNEYFINFTVPSGPVELTVEAEVYTEGQWK